MYFPQISVNKHRDKLYLIINVSSYKYQKVPELLYKISILVSVRTVSPHCDFVTQSRYSHEQLSFYQ